MARIDLFKEILEAEGRIRGYVRETPLEYSPFLSRLGGAQIYLKLENLQVSGSFKSRGVFNKLLSCNNCGEFFVTASSGNHGVAFAYATKLLGLKGLVFLPENASPAKIQDIMLYEVDIRFYGRDSVETETYARRYAESCGATYVPPYNDVKVVAGQGTVGVELVRQLKVFDVVLVPVGGGGLVSGIATYLKNVIPDVRVVGVQPENSAVMYHSLRAGRILSVESKPTLADGVAGGVEENSITFDLCKRYVDDFVLTSEAEIAGTIKLMLEKHHMLIEGSAALPIAAYLRDPTAYRGKRVVLVVTGCRIDLKTLKKILET
ncbi:MAG: threonine/serine dehydratase [Zestosphaera sp.]